MEITLMKTFLQLAMKWRKDKFYIAKESMNKLLNICERVYN